MSVRRTFPDIKAAWEGVYFGILNDEVLKGRPVIDYYQRNIIHSYDNHIIAKAGVMDFDLGHLGMTPTKWTKFTGQYVDVESLHVWVNNAMNVKAYDSLWQFKDVPPNFSGHKAVHQWGKCLLGYSFRRQGGPPTLSLYTRAQSVGFSGVADYALAAFVINKLAERMGTPPERIRFQIFCPNLILKTVEAPAFLHQRGLLDEYMERDDRIGESVRYYYHYMMDKDEEDIRWRSARRWKRKLEASIAGNYREMPVSGLTLKGWHEESRHGRKLNARDSAKLILSGVGKRARGPEVIEV